MAEGASVLYRQEEIRRTVHGLGRAIARDYCDSAPILISVLKGSSMFLADLIREIPVPVRVDFISISSYARGGEPTGVVRILKDLDHDIGGEDVIIVEDIIDTGLTLSYLISVLEPREPRSIAVCGLLDKTARRIVPLEIRYRGFECPDRFVVGYGLDFAERYRNLPDILAVDSPAALADEPDLLVPFIDERVPPAPPDGEETGLSDQGGLATVDD